MGPRFDIQHHVRTNHEVLNEGCRSRRNGHIKAVTKGAIGEIELSGKLRKDANGSTNYKPHSLTSVDGLMASTPTSQTPASRR